MALVAGNRQEGMRVAVNVKTGTGDFAVVVDRFGKFQKQRRVWRDQGVQVCHRAVLPQENMGREGAAGTERADNLSLRVN